MANTTSAKKNVRKNEKKRLVNLARKTSVKNIVKRVITAISEGEDIAKVKELMREAESKLARSKNKILHKNAVERKISRLSKKVADYSKAKTA